MSIEKATIKTLAGEEVTVVEQASIPCFRCGVCCTCYTPPVTLEEIDKIASALGISRSKCMAKYTRKAPTREGYLLKTTQKGCVFLEWDADGKARCVIYPSRPRACREWAASLSKPECLQGLAKLRSRGQIMVLEELLPSPREREELYLSLKEARPQVWEIA